ncbi:MAG: sulfotransferase, partial [Lentisphaerae bacterium]|nr:sulfotransferase [Lentisphaerota bacterium]
MSHAVCRPSFFVVGAPKAGTTALYAFLKQHPGVYLPKEKELHYFSRRHVAQSYYHPWYVKTGDAYAKLYAD